MSTGSDPHASQVSEQTIEQIRRQINRLFEEVSHLCEQDLKPANFYAEFLQRVLTGIAAPAGAVWLRTTQGNLQLQYQINMRQLGLENDEPGRQGHDELLRQAIQTAKPAIVPPHSGNGTGEPGQPAPSNPTAFTVLMAPIVVDKAVAGLLEIWQDPRHNPDALPGFLQFVIRMANLASVYTRNSQLRQMVGQQQVWTQLEAFARQVHGSLNPTEVSYIVANEGRRLIECDRVSVAIRLAQKNHIEAISGADVVEKRSNLVQLMRKLADEIVNWGERLVYTGTKDDSLPPAVVSALDAYLAESSSKLLVVLPLKDERESEGKRPARATILIESFDPPPGVDQMIARLEVVGRHATSALYNSVEHKRIPFRWIWMPLAKVQEGLGGKTRAIMAGVGVGLVLAILILIFVPYPLKMDAKGQLLPVERRQLYSIVEGQVAGFASGLQPGSQVYEGQPLILMHDVKLEMKLRDLRSEIEGAEKEVRALGLQYNEAQNLGDKIKISSEKEQKQALANRKREELEAMYDRTNADRNRVGFFWVKSPLNGTVLSADFREQLTNRYVKASEQLLRVGDKDQAWEIELKIPQKHIGQVLQAYKDPANPDEELDVDLLLLSEPTQTYKGKLARGKIAGEANPNRDDNNESEPVVLAWVRIDGPGIPEADQLPRKLLLTGTEVHSKIRCGNHRMGYSLFYGVWEFLYEKVVFWF
ncbi:MAG: hypothetical protein K2R98_27040 [Gemmataceae bacterium]|nr:hypothetical protein [Gemmataceae bacterium]